MAVLCGTNERLRHELSALPHAIALGWVDDMHAQHQLLVAIKGHPGDEPPSIREIAGYLMLQSHSAVGLVGRAENAGFVRRRPDTKPRELHD